MKTLFGIIFCLPLIAIGQDYDIAFKKGEVKVLRAGKEVTGRVQVGDRVEVGTGGLVVLKNTQETIKLTENSVLVPSTLNVQGESVVDLLRGGLVAHVNKKAFKVRTRTASMGVRGTRFFVSEVGKDLWMCVKEGEVEVKGIKGETRSVTAGKGVFVKDGRAGKARPFEWTKQINWDTESESQALPADIKINAIYKELIEHNYD